MDYEFLIIDGKKYRIKTSNNHSSFKKAEKNDNPAEEGEEFDLAVDLSNTSIIPLDGIYIEEINDEIKMICYHFESDFIESEYNVLKCDGIIVVPFPWSLSPSKKSSA